MRQSIRSCRFVCALMLLSPAIFVAAGAADGDVPYVPTPEATVKKMLEVVNAGPNDVVYDLGSGDGRIVIAAGMPIASSTCCRWPSWSSDTNHCGSAR